MTTTHVIAVSSSEPIQSPFCASLATPAADCLWPAFRSNPRRITAPFHGDGPGVRRFDPPLTAGCNGRRFRTQEFKVTAFAALRPSVRVAAALAVALAASGCVTSGFSDLTGVVAAYNPLAERTSGPRTLPLLVASTYGEGSAGKARFSEVSATIPPGHVAGVIERPVVTPKIGLAPFHPEEPPAADRTGVPGTSIQAACVTSGSRSGRAGLCPRLQHRV